MLSLFYPKKEHSTVLMWVNDKSSKTISHLETRSAAWPPAQALLGKYKAFLFHFRERKGEMITKKLTVHYHSGGSMKLNACILLLAHMVYL
jgi:hypothetical protein